MLNIPTACPPRTAKGGVNRVRIRLTGSRGADFAAADAQAGVSEAWRKANGYTWHHSQKLGTMELVQSAAHNLGLGGAPHAGGVAIGEQLLWSKIRPLNMKLISYQDFARLKIRDFFPEGTRLFLDETGSTKCAIGSAATEGMAFTYFAWKPDEPRQTAEIALDFREECPAEIGRRILSMLKLSLHPGMTLAEVRQVLGQPELSNMSSDGEGFVRFVCGDVCPYFVGCNITKDSGVTGIIIFRKDYWQPPM